MLSKDTAVYWLIYYDLFLLYSKWLVLQGWILSFEDRSIEAVILDDSVSELHVLFVLCRTCTYSQNAVSPCRLF